jgi:uncharacterized membrane protein YeaQ/YmgE (transglycosylase-associated protein family)
VSELTPQHIVIWVFIGGMFGWIADAAFKATRFGALGNILLGIAGAFGGSWVFDTFDVTVSLGNPFLEQLFVAFIGAIALLSIVAAFERATK